MNKVQILQFGEPLLLGGSTGRVWKAAGFDFFSKQNEKSFIQDQYCHLVDGGSLKPNHGSGVWKRHQKVTEKTIKLIANTSKYLLLDHGFDIQKHKLVLS